MKEYFSVARACAAKVMAFGFGVAIAGLGVNAASAESRGHFDAATSLAVGSAALDIDPGARDGGFRILGFTGSAATGELDVSMATGTTGFSGLRSTRFGGDASLLVNNRPVTTRQNGKAKTGAGTGFSKPYHAQIVRHARANGVPVALALAVVRVESNYNAKARGSAGEVGLMQIKPRTARGMGFTGSTTALYNPDTNLQWGMKYLAGAYKRAGGDTCGTIMRYQGGHYAKRMSRTAVSYCSKVKLHMAGKWA